MPLLPAKRTMDIPEDINQLAPLLGTESDFQRILLNMEQVLINTQILLKQKNDQIATLQSKKRRYKKRLKKAKRARVDKKYNNVKLFECDDPDKVQVILKKEHVHVLHREDSELTVLCPDCRLSSLRPIFESENINIERKEEFGKLYWKVN